MRTFEQDFPSHPRVLILDGAVHPEFYRPIAHWTKHLRDVQWEAVSLVCGQTIESLEGFTHLIVTGSEDRIVSPRPWHEVEAKLVRLAAQRGMAILGSCFGHQMLARELMTGRHAVASRTPEMGWLPIERLDNKTTEKAKDGLLAGLPDPFYVFCSHFDEVIDVEPPWRALARSAHCGVQVMRWGNRPVWGVQAHPEIGPPDAQRLLEGFLAHHPEQAALIEPALAATPQDDGVVGRMVENFLQAQPWRPTVQADHAAPARFA